MFMPVIFACLLNGQCEFYTDDVTNIKACEAAVKSHIQMAQQSGKFSMAYGSCIQVTFAKTKDI